MPQELSLSRVRETLILFWGFCPSSRSWGQISQGDNNHKSSYGASMKSTILEEVVKHELHYTQ